MRQFYSILAVAIMMVITTNSGFGQGVSFNTTGALAHSSAIIDASSTSQGVLVPRMTAAQKTAISSPATGLMIFQTDGTPGFYYYTGSAWSAVGGSSLPSGTNGQVLQLVGGVPTWVSLSAAYTTMPPIGYHYGGGVLAYFLLPGDVGYDPLVPHGLIAATNDQSTGKQWYNGSSLPTGATAVTVGTGHYNTLAIIASQGTGSYAATICTSYSGGGYTDWYLPSADELNKLYINRVAIGGFATTFYWSSSEGLTNFAWLQNFDSGAQLNANKANSNYVRAVRAF